MIFAGIPYLSALLLGFAVASLVYVVLAIRSTLGFRHQPVTASTDAPPATILKPVCGLDADLYNNLRSFCQQAYPCYQIVFGASSADDAAIPIIRQLLDEFPDLDIDLVIDSRIIGSNLKVCNLANMQVKARHDLLVIADSDMLVDENYLATVVSCFEDPQVGAATCLYTGTPYGGIASLLGASFINKWFLPSVLVALSFQKLSFCFGATMAVRKTVLEKIGGFERLASILADDYMLGNLVSAQGYKVALVPYLVRNIVHEASVQALFLHELRWARTVRSVQPVGYSMSFLTHAVPMSLCYLAVTPNLVYGYIIVGLALTVRLLMHFAARRHLQLESPSPIWLIPVRDLMCFAVWVASFFGRNVDWRQNSFTIQDDGYMTHKESNTL